jgi:membrane protease YdiL (CAAX protease family)
MYCPRCRDEFRGGFTWCNDCNVALVDDPDAAPADPGTAREGTDILDDQPPVTVGQYFNAIEAHGHRMALEQAGLRAWVRDENIGATYGVGIGTKLQVRAGDEAAARAILEMDSAAASADLWSDLPDDVVEPPEAVAPTLPEPEAAPEEPSVEKDRRFETLELVAVVLVTCASPIFWNVLSERDLLPSKPGQLLASIPWYAGLTLVVWILLRRRRAALSPRPLPRALPPWVGEIFAGGMLFFALWILDPVISGLLRQMGVLDPRDFEARWTAFFRQTGMAAVYPFESFFAATYEEVVFRAYLIARLSLVLGRPAWAVLLAAALFAIPHGYPPNSTLTVFAFGVVLGWVYLRSRSLPRLVIAHWIFNLAVMNRYLHD